MSTTYSDVYDFFLSKISEYTYLTMAQDDLEVQLRKILRSAIVSFSKSKVDLRDRDETLKVFNKDLNDDEKEVLSTFMMYHFLTPKVLASENYKQMMSDSDFKIYSQANHLNALQALRKDTKKEAGKLMTEYTYKQRDLSYIPLKDDDTAFSAILIEDNPYSYKDILPAGFDPLVAP